MKQLSLKQKLHQMFILGFEGTNPLLNENKGFINALEQGLGGVIFFTQNIKDKNTLQDSIKIINKKALIKPFLSIDQEGGRVERTQNIYNGSHYKDARTSAKLGEDFVKRQSKQLSKELKEFGFNMNFAPVLDVDTNPKNPIIAERSFSSNPDEVIKYGKIVIDEYLKNKIIPVGKHFPGHGETFVDSHKEMPVLDLSLNELERTHIKPFKSLTPFLPAVMVAHIHYKAFDNEQIPASISQNVIKKYLRKTLNFKGLIISDDMVMGGIKGFSSIDACIKGINAGINMFIFRNSDSKTLSLIEKLENAANQGEIDIKNIDKSVELINKVKSKYLN